MKFPITRRRPLAAASQRLGDRLATLTRITKIDRLVKHLPNCGCHRRRRLLNSL